MKGILPLLVLAVAVAAVEPVDDASVVTIQYCSS